MLTLCIDGGKKAKIRPGDILGALTADQAISGDRVGKINIFPMISYVAVDRGVRKKALKLLAEGKIKGRRFKVRAIN